MGEGGGWRSVYTPRLIECMQQGGLSAHSEKQPKNELCLKMSRATMLDATIAACVVLHT